MLGEMALLRPILAGDDATDQLLEIFDLLGTPTEEDMRSMNVEAAILGSARNLMIREPEGKPEERISALLGGSYSLLSDVVSKLLIFNPTHRASAKNLLEHELFSKEINE